MSEQGLQLLLKDDVIVGFSYSFSKALLEKLKALKKEDRIFEEEWKEAQNQDSSHLTEIARCVMEHLETQLNCDISGFNPDKVDCLISFAEEFLAIFEKKERMFT